MKSKKTVKLILSICLLLTLTVSVVADVTVFITRTGKKYHREYCRTVRNGSSPISKSKARSQGYTACKVCKP